MASSPNGEDFSLGEMLRRRSFLWPVVLLFLFASIIAHAEEEAFEVFEGECDAFEQLAKYLDENKRAFQLRDMGAQTAFSDLRDTLSFHNRICAGERPPYYEGHRPGAGREEGVIDDRTVEQVKELAGAAPVEFQTAAFHCVSDFERCHNYYVSKDDLFSAELCGIPYLICVATQLIPF